ncbi:MAG: XrtA/PEP-CTERM system TPR-repeat protein PrsT [Pseudomonadota bacterium]
MKTFLRITVLACALTISGCDWFASDEDHIARAEKFIASGEERAAAIELQNVLGSTPDNVRARLMLARLSLRQGDAQAAGKELQKAIESHAPAADVGAIDADIHLAKGDYPALLAILDGGKSGLDTTDLAIYRGLALIGARDLDGARNAFNAALAASPESARARRGLADTKALGGDFDGALVDIDKLLAAVPGDAQAWSLKGRILGRRGDFKAASEALANARKHAPGQLTALEYNSLLSALVESHVASGDVASARSALAALNKRAPDAPLVHLLGARIAMAEQNYPLAVTEGQKVIAAAPNHPMAKMVLGAALLANGNYHQAEAQLAELVAQSPENMEARKLLADVNLRLRRPDVAMQVLMPAQESATTDPQVESLLAWANLQRGDEAVAIELLKRSVAGQPANLDLKFDLALAYFTAGRHAEAIDLLDSLPAQPGSVRRERLLIAAIAAGKSPQAAQTEVETIVKAHASDIGVLNIAASFYAQNRNFVRARELLRSSIAIEPANLSSLSSLARLEVAAGDDLAARAALQKLLDVDPANQAAHLSLAQLEMRNKNPNAATAALETARNADKKAIEPRVLLAAQYLRERNTREADDVLRELALLAESNPTVAVVTGRLYTEAGRYDEALNQFRAAVRREPRNPSWYLEVARVLVARGDQAAARDAIQKALDIDPQGIAANSLMIGLELKEGRKPQALARATQMRKAHPHDAGAAILEGDLHFALRDGAAAANAYADAYRLEPSSVTAIRVYQSRKIGRLPAADALLTDWLRREPKDLTARMVYAQSLLEQGQYPGAIVQYEQVMAGGRPGAMALNNLAWLYQQAKDSRAEATAKLAYDIAPEMPAIADTYGWILVEAGKPADALPVLERAIGGRGATPEMRYHHAVALAKGGRTDDARASLKRLLADPAFAQAAQARNLLKELGEGS